MIAGLGLGHGSDGEKGAVISTEGLTQHVLSQVDLRSPHLLQFGQMHLNTKINDLSPNITHTVCNNHHLL